MPCCGPPGTCDFEVAHRLWMSGDFASFLDLFPDDIMWIVHLDGITSPFAQSAVGKEDLRWRLQHMMDVFDVTGFDIELMDHREAYCRSLVRLTYIHKRTGELLDVKVRFTGFSGNGRLVRMEETADREFVAAYTRFVHYLEETSSVGQV